MVGVSDSLLNLGTTLVEIPEVSSCADQARHARQPASNPASDPICQGSKPQLSGTEILARNYHIT